MPISVGDVISFGSAQVAHATDGQSRQCGNPHTFVVDGLEDLLPASPLLARIGSTQPFTDASANAASQPSQAEEQRQPTAGVFGRERADSSPPLPPEDSGPALATAQSVEGATPQELAQQPDPAGHPSSLPASVSAADLQALLPSVSESRPLDDAVRLEDGMANRPASVLESSIIDLTEVSLEHIP